MQRDLINNLFEIVPLKKKKHCYAQQVYEYLRYHRSQQQNEKCNQGPPQSWQQPRAQPRHPTQAQNKLNRNMTHIYIY